MHRNIASMVVIAGLVVGTLAFHAAAEDRGRMLEERVSALEASAERQRRAIDSLREENADQQRLIQRLLRFRTDTNERLAVLEHRTRRLNGRGVYSGPVDNGQVQLGSDPAACAGEVAEWNGAGTSLGCIAPTP